MIIKIGNAFVGKNHPCYIIAEIGINFNGDLELARKSIEEASNSGANAVKFQTFKAEEFVADKDLAYTYSLKDGTEKTETQYELFKRLELPYEWHNILKAHALTHGIDFLSSAADIDSVNFLCELGLPAIKVASEDLINVRLLEHLAQVNVPVIISTGMADESEIAFAMELFKKQNKNDIILLHCVSTYPAPAEDCNLKRISALHSKYPFPVGYSDHSEGILASIISLGLGVCLIEKHFTIDNELDGPDHKFSANPVQFATMVKKIRLAEIMLGNEALHYSNSEVKGRMEFRRSIVANKYILSGEIITENMLDYKRPGKGLRPYQRDIILGKRSLRNIKPGEMIQTNDVG